MSHSTLFPALSLLLLPLVSACAPTVSQPVTPAEIVRTEPVEVPHVDTSLASSGIQADSLQSFTTLIDWPEKPALDQCAASNVGSSVDDGVLIEGRMLVRRSLDDLYADLTTPEIVGPFHLTRDFERDEFVEESLKTSYVLHVKMRYILSIEFDLAWTIEPVFRNGERVGYVATTEKVAGTSHLKQISNKIHLLEVEPGLVSIEISSFNRATMNKESESKAYVTGLAEYWARCVDEKASAKDVETISEAQE